MHPFANSVLDALVAHKSFDTDPVAKMPSVIVMQESDWFENAEVRLFEGMELPDASFLMVDTTDTLSAMQTKERCRQLLACTGFREAGWPALALFDRLLVTFATGEDFIQPTGWSNTPPETGYGLMPSLFVCNASLWATTYLNAAKAGDVQRAAIALCKLAVLMTMLVMGLPHPRLREEDQPAAEKLA